MLFIASPGNCFYLAPGVVKLTEDQKYRIFILLALLIGWIIVIFFRSGTAWG